MKTKRLSFGLNSKISQSGIDFPADSTKEEIIMWLDENKPQASQWKEVTGGYYKAHYNNGQFLFK